MASERRAATRAANQPSRASLGACSARSRIYASCSGMLVRSRAVRERIAAPVASRARGSY